MPSTAPRTIYRTATSLNGFIADEQHSLGWLFAAEHDDSQQTDHERFLEGIGALVEGSATYEWVLREANLLEEPQRWKTYYGDRPTYVFSSRELPTPEGADVRFVRGLVRDSWPAIAAAASGGDIWIVGGGDLAGQFFDAGLLDQIDVSIAPVALPGGAPLLPRRAGSDRLRLVSTSRKAQFILASYEVLPGKEPL
jgi:dihydrofolate reductase